MTHPLTPREKVARAIQAHDNDHVPDGYADGLSDEVSDWSAYLADRVLTALASGSGDHAELARLAEAGVAAAESGDLQALADSDQAFFTFFGPRVALALIAENAALRGERDEWRDTAFKARSANTEAERKLAEAVGLKHLTDGQLFKAINAAVTITKDRNGVERNAVCISPEKFRTFLECSR